MRCGGLGGGNTEQIPTKHRPSGESREQGARNKAAARSHLDDGGRSERRGHVDHGRVGAGGIHSLRHATKHGQGGLVQGGGPHRASGVGLDATDHVGAVSLPSGERSSNVRVDSG